MTIPPAVLAAYPDAVRRCRWVPLPPGGGLNGSSVWRGDGPHWPLFALKHWSKDITPARLRVAHERMRIVTDSLPFVPRLVSTTAGQSVYVHEGCCWDVSGWRDGEPELLTPPGDALSFVSPVYPQLEAAGTALAALHRAWLPPVPASAPCSAVARRFAILADWNATRFSLTDGEFIAAAGVVQSRVAGSMNSLGRLASLRGRVIPIHGDYWPENVLFRHARLTAVLDFGNTTEDFAEVDLARLLADVPATNRTLTDAAVNAYNANGPFHLSVPLIETLIDTGRVCSLARWLLRINAGEVSAADALRRVRRLAALVSG
jgi:aminoglycoside phosphotransferase (APT) family kinase protein